MARNTAKQKALREAFKSMDPNKAQAIRVAYYQVQEGLERLAVELAQEKEIELVEEWVLAFTAMSEMQKSQLGKVL